MLDKFGRVRAEIGIACFILGAIISYKRLKTAIIFNKSVHYAIASYDIIISCLYLVISMHSFMKESLTITSLALYLVTILILVILSLFFAERKAKQDLIKITRSSDQKVTDDPLEFERLMYRLFKSI